MHGPFIHSPEYEVWARKLIADSEETIRRSQAVIAAADKHLAALDSHLLRPTIKHVDFVIESEKPILSGPNA